MAETTNNRWVMGSIAVAMPLISLAIGALTTWIWKVDDRQYELSRKIPVEYASKQDLEKSISQFSDSVNSRLDAFYRSSQEQREDRKHFQEKILEEVKGTNKMVQDLALKLEKRTRE